MMNGSKVNRTEPVQQWNTKQTRSLDPSLLTTTSVALDNHFSCSLTTTSVAPDNHCSCSWPVQDKLRTPAGAFHLRDP